MRETFHINFCHTTSLRQNFVKIKLEVSQLRIFKRKKSLNSFVK